jgi:pteridine reductase
VTPPRPVVLVTGAGQRVGRAIAVHLSGLGYDVAVHFHQDEGGARETVAKCKARGVKSAWFPADLSDPAAPEMLVARVTASLGRIDALVNSAAIMLRTPLETVSPAQWDRIFAINLRAPFFVSLAAARVMKEGGSIVNIADHLAHESWPGLVPHGVSKAGVETLTRQLAKQLAPRIRVNAVSPGAVLPPSDWPADARERFVEDTLLRRLGTPDDVAGGVAYLLSAPYVTGHVLVVDGGRQIR